MKKISYFLMVGLVFTALQTATVEAQSDDCMNHPAGSELEILTPYNSGSGSPRRPTVSLS